MDKIYMVCYSMRDSCCEHTKAFYSMTKAKQFMSLLMEVKIFADKSLKESNEKAGEIPNGKWYQTFSQHHKLFHDWLERRNKIYYELMKQMPENLKTLDKKYPQLYMEIWIEEIEVE